MNIFSPLLLFVLCLFVNVINPVDAWGKIAPLKKMVYGFNHPEINWHNQLKIRLLKNTVQMKIESLVKKLIVQMHYQ
jgi:hypothetical protein